jgi:hypothetical protein
VESTGKQMAMALAAEGYVVMSASHSLCEVADPRLPFEQLLRAVAEQLHLMDGKVILRTQDGRRRMYRICGGIIAEVVESLPPVHVAHMRSLQPQPPRYAYYGIAPVGKGKWRAVVNTTDPVTHKTHIITGHYVDDRETAAREHDRIAREYAGKGMIGGRVHLNFPAGGNSNSR